MPRFIKIWSAMNDTPKCHSIFIKFLTMSSDSLMHSLCLAAITTDTGIITSEFL